MINKQKYPHKVDVYLTERQYTLLIEKSKKNNLTISDFLRMQIEYAPKNLASMQELMKNLIYEINKIGVNINQIAHAANMGLLNSREKTELFAYIEKLNKDMKKAVTLFGNK